jgi:phage host-nuclease inhibitor protein Gam
MPPNDAELNRIREDLERIWKQLDSMKDAVSKNRENHNDKLADVSLQLSNQISKVAGELNTLAERVKSNKEESDNRSEHYVTKAEFSPVKHIIYSLISIVLLGVLTAAIKFVVPNAAFPG